MSASDVCSEPREPWFFEGLGWLVCGFVVGVVCGAVLACLPATPDTDVDPPSSSGECPLYVDAGPDVACFNCMCLPEGHPCGASEEGVCASNVCASWCFDDNTGMCFRTWAEDGCTSPCIIACPEGMTP